MRRRRALAGALLVALAAGPAAPGLLDGSMTPEEELEQGFEFDRELLGVLPVVDDPVVLGFVHELGGALVERLGEPEPVYHFRVIRDPSLNAFAIPGGYIYLHSGTVLAAGGVDELAGVLAHEIGHVKGRHVARLQEKTSFARILSTLAGIAASAAVGDAGPMVVSQGINVALQLRFSREFEAEADEMAVILMRRTGFDPAGLRRFFQRIVIERDRGGETLPPYLYSHPEVESRIARVEELARRVPPAAERPLDFDAGFVRARDRLAALVALGRSEWPVAPAFDRERGDAALREAEALARAGRTEEAAARLEAALAELPGDPRLPFRLAELRAAAGRRAEAIRLLERAVSLDPTRALPHFRLAELHAGQGDRQRATFHLEQALRRFRGTGGIRARAERMLLRLTFPVVREHGVVPTAPGGEAELLVGRSASSVPAGTRALLWWGALHRRFAPQRSLVEVRLLDGQGRPLARAPAETGPDGWLLARLELPEDAALAPGPATVEVRVESDPVAQIPLRVVAGSTDDGVPAD